MPKLKTLLIHPDPEIRTALRDVLEDVRFIQVLGEAVSAFEAMEMLEAIPYGVFFVGVDLPGGASGIEMAQMLAGRKHKPALVFISDTETHAYAAFELGATDYLLWPPATGRMARTVDRLQNFKSRFREVPTPASFAADADDPDDPNGERERTVQLPLPEEEQDSFLAALKSAWDQTGGRRLEIEKLAVSQDGRTILIPYDQIIFVEAFEDYSYVHTANQKFLSSHRLKNLEDRLEPHRFFRVHRKYLVNLDMVTEIASMPGSNFMLRTAGRTRIELPISRRRIAELKKVIGL
ncbi:MAG: LytTR family DNA-binding domain-containing protein [Pseudodesulfovibrio sp.]|uniref:LytTr DNA-binding region n=1 Tax=Pseudodesulfovibrio aespoeensis (strain ATCC 700646 / DSM 10631 / Aspo-2) TaxID=643562 RepID=E6VZH0_PSEA9|nr:MULTISPECIES: LytTR family DNA-binding domain-containing protein [Pseudodesulfovibrio]MBU4379651.1 LytTR family DNA-binding domain-containing protein [Pseudomonadota bacterium]ADU61684.1 LytTr DNA-binding region [Pseudodesulfovibrio aespoeensis Aspo-2]MBU4474107.1 LytTR family DNA-binding domain-containing protein [Pseudomonadota bacterium]MBU4517501.1 LytTR family DNA-binding domain-containing protein [Pseudomonadota bacterium]MBU4522158.1 LytTR family DNA-binding domain-containing protein